MSGHCEHCGDMCDALGEHGSADLNAVWSVDCPACEERERIVAFLRMRRDETMMSEADFWPITAAALSVAAGDISLGAHLDAAQ